MDQSIVGAITMFEVDSKAGTGTERVNDYHCNVRHRMTSIKTYNKVLDYSSAFENPDRCIDAHTCSASRKEPIIVYDHFTDAVPK